MRKPCWFQESEEIEMTYFEQEGNALIFRDNGETLRIEPWQKDSLRVRSSLLSEIQEGSVALLAQETSSANIVLENETRATITNGKLTAVLEILPWGKALQITYKNQKGEILLREIANGGALNLKARSFKALPGGDFRLKVTFESNPEEKIYGMGQYQQERMNLKGCNLELAHRNSQASIPFYMSSLGYGFLWHNAAVGEVHFGSNTTEWMARASKQMDYWITAGDTPAEIEENYANAVGKVPMMPECGLGFWQCKLRYSSQEEVLKVAREYKKRNIPLDVLVIDFFHWPKCGDYRFDPEFFPNPKAMVRELHDMGIETMVSIWPQISSESENFEEMQQQGLLVKSNAGIDVQMVFQGNNVFLDPTNARARTYVWNKCKEGYAELGIRMFWLDEAEPEFSTYDYECYRYAAGPVEEVGNIFPREYSRLFYEGQKENGQEEVVNLVRCAWVGSQQYGALVWSGDISSTYEDFRKQICAGLHMGIAGIPWWTTDIGGFHGGVSDNSDFRELLVRWFQFGTFCPVMRIHGDRVPGKAIMDSQGKSRQGSGGDNEIWSFGEENYQIFRKYIGIRELMRDYIREQMQESHEKGTPVIRTLFYEFPSDAQCWDIKDEYMFGPDILVAPIVYAHARSREVYLPEGTVWTLASTGEHFQGGKSYEIDAPIETIPIFLRNGAQSYLINKI